MAASYRWIITKVHLEDEGDEVGTTGPRNLDENLKSNPEHFSVYDDDGECYAEGMLYSTDAANGTEETCFAPLNDFASPNWGCTMMKLGGEWL